MILVILVVDHITISTTKQLISINVSIQEFLIMNIVLLLLMEKCVLFYKKTPGFTFKFNN